jgi:hypothetical protein
MYFAWWVCLHCHIYVGIIFILMYFAGAASAAEFEDQGDQDREDRKQEDGKKRKVQEAVS